jgi:hypothetical protein
MNPDLRSAAMDLVERAKAKGVAGKTANTEMLRQLNLQLNGQIPEWYQELILTIPICGLEIGWQQWEPDENVKEDDGIGWLEIYHEDGIRQDCLQFEPGSTVFKRGFLCIAGDSSTCETLYVVSLSAGDNPPVYQIYEDDVYEDDQDDWEAGDFPGIVVAESLAELFRSNYIYVRTHGRDGRPLPNYVPQAKI